MRRGEGVIALAALSAALAIGAGAFGAHADRGAAIAWLQTGAAYQLVHAAAAVALAQRWPGQARLLLLGALLFAGSLYLMALGGPRWLGAITPVGGVAMIAGWLWLAARVLRR